MELALEKRREMLVFTNSDYSAFDFFSLNNSARD